MTLCDLRQDEPARVVAVRGAATERRRLTELGLRAGARVRVVRRAPFGGALAVRVGGSLLAVRPVNAARVLVERVTGDG